MKAEEGIFKDSFDRIEEQASRSIVLDEKDYILDGLWYCHKCNTPKQCRVELFGRIRTPMCLCKCAVEKRNAEEEEYKRRQRQQRIAELRKTGFPDSDMQGWTFAADDKENAKISKACLNYVEHFDEFREMGKGLLLYGKVGTGKTFYAACIANALIDRGFPCMVTNFARLVNTISGMFDGKQEYIDRLNKFDLLVIDDLATERDTEYMNEIVQNIIDSRYRAGLPTIITTNLTAEEMKNPKEIHKQRLFSRILEMCVPIAVEGGDRRRQKSKEDYSEFKNMLGL